MKIAAAAAASPLMNVIIISEYLYKYKSTLIFDQHEAIIIIIGLITNMNEIDDMNTLYNKCNPLRQTHGWITPNIVKNWISIIADFETILHMDWLIQYKIANPSIVMNNGNS